MVRNSDRPPEESNSPSPCPTTVCNQANKITTARSKSLPMINKECVEARRLSLGENGINSQNEDGGTELELERLVENEEDENAIRVDIEMPETEEVEPRERQTSMRRFMKTFSKHFSKRKISFKNSLRRNRQPENQESINRNREKKLAYISLYIVWLFIFCHVWKLIPTAFEVLEGHDDENGFVLSPWPKWLPVIEKVSHTLVALNSSLNFLIYAVM